MQTHQEQVRSGERRKPDEHQRGTKRPADDSLLNDEQRFTKRFNLLNIGGVPDTNGNSSAYYIPVSSPSDVSKPRRTTVGASQQNGEEPMQLDDTTNRVFIHNLDAELAEIDSSEEQEKLIFIPDIEKKLSKIPQHVLRGSSALSQDHEEQQLVLYSVPHSLTGDEGSRSVRRAILESRQWARERALREEQARHQDMERKYEHDDAEVGTETAHGYGSGYDGEEVGEDPDAMDIG